MVHLGAPSPRSRRSSRSSAIGFLLTIGLVVMGQEASAQAVRGRVLDPSGQPIPVALLTLLDEQSTVVRTALTASDGTFSFATGRPGAFRLRVERIGLQTHTTEPFDLTAGQVRDLPLVLSMAPVTLAGIEAESSSRCVVRPETGGGLAALWEEARKGLQITAAVEAGGVVRLTGVHYVRELDGTGRRQTAVLSRESFSTTRTPFDALDAATLARSGFAVFESDGSLSYFGPSPAVLLSDPFLDQHCFNRVVDHASDSALLGLGFEPVRGTRTVGIAGTLWLDRASAEIRRIEYAYRDPNGRLPDGGHGSVEIVRLTNGAPVISTWWIRMPTALQLPRVGSGVPIRVTALREEGGIVLDGEGSPIGEDGGVLAEVQAGIDGSDPGRRDGLTLVTIQSSAFGTEVRTNTAPGGMLGRRLLEELEDRGARMEHTVALLAPSLTVSRGVFRTEDSGPEEIVCVALPLDATGSTIGAAGVTNAVAGRGIAGAATAGGAAPLCRMIEVYLDGSPIEAAGRHLASASPSDFESAQILDSHAILMLESRDPSLATSPPVAAADAPSSDAVDDALDALDDDALADALDGALADILSRNTLGAETLVVGRVADATTELPVVGATIALVRGSERYSARTDADGTFRIAGIPEGRYGMDVRHLAFPEVRDSIGVVGGGRVTRVDVGLHARVVELSPIVVTAAARPTFGALAPVYDRIEAQRAAGLGRIWDRTELERSGAFAVSDLLTTIPGVQWLRTVTGSGSTERVSLSAMNPPICATRGPLFFLDGIRMDLGGERIESWVPWGQIEAVEIYRRPAEVPADFGGSDAQCGVIAVSTRRGGG